MLMAYVLFDPELFGFTRVLGFTKAQDLDSCAFVKQGFTRDL